MVGDACLQWRLSGFSISSWMKLQATGQFQGVKDEKKNRQESEEV